jgi:hypothetical protein
VPHNADSIRKLRIKLIWYYTFIRLFKEPQNLIVLDNGGYLWHFQDLN